MSRRPRWTRELLESATPGATSAVDLMRALGVPLDSANLRYLLRRLDHYAIATDHFGPEPLPERPRTRYERETLAEAAACSNSLREVLDRLGRSPDGSAYTHLRRRLDHFGIDTSHFTRGRGRTRLSQEEIADAVTHARSVAGVLRHLGLPDTGGNRRYVTARIAEHGFCCAHFTGRGHRAGVPSPRRAPASAVLRRLPPGSRRTRTSLLRRALDDTGISHRCAACGLGDQWQGRRLVLQIDHRNGDRLDNRQENLRYLCPSCHSQTATFGAGRARESPSATR